MEATELFITPQEQCLDRKAMRQTEESLRKYLLLLHSGQCHPASPRLILDDGNELELSPSAVHALQFVLHHMACEEMIAFMPLNKMLTTNQAADVLNVSRPFLVKLLHEGKIKFTMTGTHHRLRVGDVLEYKQHRDREMLDVLDDLANEAQAAGNYFDE